MNADKFYELVSKNPDNELFRFSHSQALAHEGRHAEAVDGFDFCLKKKPDWMMAAILKGKSQLALGQKSAARPTFEAALHLAVVQHHETPEAELRQILAGL